MISYYFEDTDFVFRGKSLTNRAVSFVDLYSIYNCQNRK